VKFWSNLHQESWEKKVDLPNCWDNHKLCKWVGKSYKKLYYTEVITKACPLRCKITHTHTHITVIIDTSEQGYNVAISSWWDMQNQTHTHRSCSQVVDLAAHGHWISSIPVDGLNNDHWTWDEIVHPGAKRFWSTYPGHSYEEGVCHKNSSRSCARGMSNPITPYHKNSSSNLEIEE
jgi:hypothetical protein